MAKEIIREDAISTIEDLGEEAVLKIGTVEYDILTVVTGTIQNEDGDERSRMETHGRSFRFVLPEGVSKVNWNDRIIYDGLEYSIINVQTGVYDIVKVLAARDKPKEIGRDRRIGR